VATNNNDKRNAYAVLGLHKGSTEDQIKQAYVALVKKYDPEVHTERFMVVQKAFNRLKDPERRAQEDILTFNVIRGDYLFNDAERSAVSPEKLDMAVQQLENMIRDEPEKTEQVAPRLIQAYFMRSWRNIQRKLTKEAIEDWMRVLDLDPTHSRAKQNLLYAFCTLGYSFANHDLNDEAIEVWEKAAQMNPDNHLIIHNLALACEKTNRVDEAARFWNETLRRWKQQLERNPDDEYLKTCIVEGHRHQGEIGAQGDGSGSSAHVPAPPPQTASSSSAYSTRPKADTQSRGPLPSSRPAPQATPSAPQRDELGSHQEILKLRPDDFDANFRVAHLLYDQKKYGEAVAHLLKLTEKFPRNIEVLNLLGWAQINKQEVEQAFKTWERGRKLEPKNMQIRESLIKAHMSMGKALRDKRIFTLSVKHFKSLDKELPENDEVHFELGTTYKLAGDMGAAYREFQHVLKLNPKHKQARTALSELKMRRA